MPRLTIATIAAEVPMGAQIYQREVTSRAASALDTEAGAGAWTVKPMVVRPLRSRMPGSRRVPLGRLGRASIRTRRIAGRLLYGRGEVVHRMALELPPALAGDVVTLHDVVAWRFVDESPVVPAAAAELRRADAVICVSEFTAGEAADLLGIRNAHVVPCGVDPRFLDARPLSAPELAELDIRSPFVLTVGGASRRKNLHGLAAAWPRVRSARSDLSLVLCGPPHPTRTTLFAGLPGAHLLGMVPDDIVPGLMAAARAVVVPSTYEGFGLPALEGMAAGVPVVASARAALPEVVGAGGILVEPDAAGLAEGIVWATSGDPEPAQIAIRGRARAEEFSWERTTGLHARLWTSVAPQS